MRVERVVFMDRYMNMLLIPGAYSHGVLRCGLYQVTISAILRSVNNEELIQQSEAVVSSFSSHS